ncbi:MAG: ribosome biogenesis GTPase Der [Magnetococcales bacterium]|nr:ribosome biogenesis GTPase Der [Magnetococcales bacterium]
MTLPLVALVGRPNVGKSTLFNRLTRSRLALVDDTPGLTRDRRYGRAKLGDLPFLVVDTGGFESDPEESVGHLIREQSQVAIEEADLVLMVTDGLAGPLTDDYQIADYLRRSGKPVIVVVNKAEGRAGKGGALEFHQLGMDPVFTLSALHGEGIGDLLEAIESRIAPLVEEETALAAAAASLDGGMGEAGEEETTEGEATERRPIRVAVVGCPNVGKSSLINRLLGEERVVTSEVAGTTRDPVDVPWTASDGTPFVWVDTAGIRRKARVTMRIEKYSVIAALRSIERADVAVVMLDATRGIGDQDKRILGYAVEAGCGLVIAVNKWDLIPQAGRISRDAFLKPILDSLPQVIYGLPFHMSAQKGQGVEQLPHLVKKAWKAASRRVGTGALNRWMAEALAKHQPPRGSMGRVVKIRYATQTAIHPPEFVFFTNHPDDIKDGYRRYLENRLREAFDFHGTPIRLHFRGGVNPYVS